MAGMLMPMVLMLAPGQAYDAYGYYQPQGYGPPQMPAAPGGYFVAAPGPGPAQVVKALGAPGAKPGSCFRCGQPGHLAAHCPMAKGAGM